MIASSTGLWICKDKRRLYEQNRSANDKPEHGTWVECDIALFRLDGTHFWVRSDDFEPVTFDMVQDAFVKLEITY